MPRISHVQNQLPDCVTSLANPPCSNARGNATESKSERGPVPCGPPIHLAQRPQDELTRRHVSIGTFLLLVHGQGKVSLVRKVALLYRKKLSAFTLMRKNAFKHQRQKVMMDVNLLSLVPEWSVRYQSRSPER